MRNLRADRTAWISLGCCAVLLLASPDVRGGDDPPDKIDADLRSAAGFQPIFVRMQDQLLSGAGDYEAFCRANESAARSALRARVLQALRSKADRSWNLVKDRLAALEEMGELKEVTRFWIINGIACEATAVACESLAQDPNVAFVYKQRGPDAIRQHRTIQTNASVAATEPKTLDELTPEQRQRIEAQLKEKGIDPAQVRVKIQAGGPTPANLPSQADQVAAMQQLLQSYHSDIDEPFHTDGLEVPWNLKLIQAEQVWNKEEITGKGAIIALNDFGIVDIPALRPALWRNPAEELNGKDDDGDGNVDDLFGYNVAYQSNFILDTGPLNHGTICAGIMAGRPIPDQPLVTGVAPRAQIMPINGMGYLKAYEYALVHGADVLSMSYMWVGMDLGQYRGVFRTAAEHLSAAGVLPLGGAGNFAKTAPDGKQICLPKDIPCVMAVAGVGEDGTRMGFSSQGPCFWDGVKFYNDYPVSNPLRKPDITAPASGFPCWHNANVQQPGWTVLWTGDGSDSLVKGPAGNSFAGPHVAGVAALVFSANPDLNAWQVKRIIEESSKDLGTPGPDNQHGAGLLQALEAVRTAKKMRRS